MKYPDAAPIDETLARRVAGETLADLRTVRKALRGAPVRGMPDDARADVRERTILTDAEVTRFLASPVVDLELKVLSVSARVLRGMRTSS